jgi:predicted ATP-dependent serine protease
VNIAASEVAVVVHVCTECLYLGPRRVSICPSCGAVNTLKPADPSFCALYFRVVRNQPSLSASGVTRARRQEPIDFEGSQSAEDGYRAPEYDAAEDDDEGDEEEEVEEEEAEQKPAQPAAVARVSSFKGGDIERMSSSDTGVDHVFNGGIPVAHCFMLSASPGGGKSTLMRQVAAGMAEAGYKVLIAAGEEAGDIAQSEFKRLKLYKRFPRGAKKVLFTGSADIDEVISAADAEEVDVLIVDSLSVLASKRVKGPPGKEKQVNYAAYHLMQAAHAQNEYEGRKPFTVLMIVHATKDGDMAGPNTAKHWTDGAFTLEHIDPASLEATDDQNKPTGFVRLRVLGKYRRGSPLNYAYYQFTEAGLVTWKPKDKDDDEPTSARKPAARSARRTPAKRAASSRRR